MDRAPCPHCKSQRLAPIRVPREVVAVVPCPSCNELAVLYRGRVIGVSRRIIESGTKSERAAHLAEVIAEFLEAGMPPLTALADALPQAGVGDGAGGEASGDQSELPPITDQEFEKFVRIDLKCLDNSGYFRRHFDRR